MILAFDTETTGKADFRAGFESEHQPRIVQLAAILYDGDIEEVMSLNVTIGRMKRSAEIYVAHNIDFDRLLVLSESFRAFGEGFEIPESRCFCTMKAMTGYCKIPGAYSDYKWPKLTEAFRHVKGMDFDGAHDALADVRACVEVYRWLQQQGKAVAA